MRHWQRECEKLNSTRNRTFRAEAERIVDDEIERVTKIEQEQAEKQQQKLL
jgi:RNA polymerase-interacting CarD/CdnL/TRCF family regulator